MSPNTLHLITNIDSAQFQSMENGPHLRLACFAILVELRPPTDSFDPPYKIRGFLSEGSLETFTLFPKTAPQLTGSEVTSPVKLLTSEGKLKPLQTFHTISFDGCKIHMALSDQNQPLDIKEFPAESILQVWDNLPAKVAHYWKHPAMPLPQWVPAEKVREATAAITHPKKFWM